MTLFIAFAVVIAAVCALGLAGRSLRLSASLVLLVLAVTYWGGSDLLGRAKPARLALLERGAPEVNLIGSYFIEDVAIWLWVQMPDAPPPRAYVLPWSLETAQDLQRARRQAERNGTGVVIRWPFRADGSTEFHAAPQPPDPAKQPVRWVLPD